MSTDDADCRCATKECSVVLYDPKLSKKIFCITIQHSSPNPHLHSIMNTPTSSSRASGSNRAPQLPTTPSRNSGGFRHPSGNGGQRKPPNGQQLTMPRQQQQRKASSASPQSVFASSSICSSTIFFFFIKLEMNLFSLESFIF